MGWSRWSLACNGALAIGLLVNYARSGDTTALVLGVINLAFALAALSFHLREEANA